jgi:hypothetical protein
MPVTVAVDSQGTTIHATTPAEWATRIAQSLPGTAVLQFLEAVSCTGYHTAEPFT